MDRFSIGLPDAQEEATHFYACRYSKCKEIMISGEDLWELDGEFYCSSECTVKEMGGYKRMAE